MLKQVNGWLWPASDTECQKVAFDLTALKAAISLCSGFKVAVQAGGNVGVWPKYLAGVFETVYTAEPDPDNFACLCANVPDANVIKLQCGFGFDVDGPMALMRHSSHMDNCGAAFLSRGDVGGATVCRFPVLRVDDFNLDDCDLLALDIEGMEYHALRGAEDLIQQNHPVILLEQKGHEARYGATADDIANFMESMRYRIETKIHRDVIWVPR